jgi:hypothetical protein
MAVRFLKMGAVTMVQHRESVVRVGLKPRWRLMLRGVE